MPSARWVFLLALIPSLSLAQLVTSTVPRERTVPVQESVESAMSAAPWQIGGLRIQPKFGVKELGYNNNVYGTDEEEAVEDWTATVFGGVVAYLPLGAKGAVSSSALPEYTWYDELDYRRHGGGYFDVSAYGFFNRLTLEGNAFTQDTQTIVNSERETQAVLDATGLSAKGELEILTRLSVFGGLDTREIAYDDFAGADDPELRFSELGRLEQAGRLGVRYRWTSFFDVSILEESTRTEFEVTPLARDNESEALLIGLHYDRPKFFLNATAGTRDGTPARGSSFPAYSEATGTWFAEYRLTAPIDLQAYGGRDIVYGLWADNPYFLETRQGAALRFQLGYRVAFRIAAESGSNDYPVAVVADGHLMQRLDDVATTSASVTVPLGRAFAVTLGAARSEYDSNMAGYDRTTLRWISTIGLRRAMFFR